MEKNIISHQGKEPHIDNLYAKGLSSTDDTYFEDGKKVVTDEEKKNEKMKANQQVKEWMELLDIHTDEK